MLTSPDIIKIHLSPNWNRKRNVLKQTQTTRTRWKRLFHYWSDATYVHLPQVPIPFESQTFPIPTDLPQLWGAVTGEIISPTDPERLRFRNSIMIWNFADLNGVREGVERAQPTSDMQTSEKRLTDCQTSYPGSLTPPPRRSLGKRLTDCRRICTQKC